jgi:hypothetical protein
VVAADYEIPWKEILDRFFEAFMAFFFPDTHAQIDPIQCVIFNSWWIVQVQSEVNDPPMWWDL